MKSLISELSTIWNEVGVPFLVSGEHRLDIAQLENTPTADLSGINAGDVVALVGDFEPTSIRTLFELIDRRAIVVPLTDQTVSQHDYFFEAAYVTKVITGTTLQELPATNTSRDLEEFKKRDSAGLILFTSGTTGRPKAILHDFSAFLERFRTPRPGLRTIGFMLFDHIGGLNTLFHTLFNRGFVVSPGTRDVKTVLDLCSFHSVELLPTTPTFLRMLTLAGVEAADLPESLRIITYGTERMDEATLLHLCDTFPQVDFRQTYGMSELGILRVKSRARDSLWIKIGGEGVETKIVRGMLHIRSQNRMVCYIDTETPFDDGWYATGDLVETQGDWIKIIGRDRDLINVAGLKFHSSELEDEAVRIPGVAFAKAIPKSNPITGQHVELLLQPEDGSEIDVEAARDFLRKNLEPHKRPMKIKVGEIEVSHRFKRS